jgi:hypothetical protein
MMSPKPEADWPPRREDFERDLDPELEASERDELLALAVRLKEQRPVPRARLRSAIRARLLGDTASVPRSRVAALILGYGASGTLLLAIAAVGLVGLGPFAA